MSSKYEELERLAKLKEQGVINEDEFIQEKNKLLKNKSSQIIKIIVIIFSILLIAAFIIIAYLFVEKTDVSENNPYYKKINIAVDNLVRVFSWSKFREKKNEYSEYIKEEYKNATACEKNIIEIMVDCSIKSSDFLDALACSDSFKNNSVKCGTTQKDYYIMYHYKKHTISSAIENFEAAKRYVKNEISKGAKGDINITNDVIEDLNNGKKKAPLGLYNEDAFIKSNNQPNVANGQVAISVSNLRELQSAETVTIFLSIKPESDLDNNWPKETSVTYIKE